jgi:hypothetical protein
VSGAVVGVGRHAIRAKLANADAREDVSRTESALLTKKESGCAEQLARFFPHARAVQVQAHLFAPRTGGRNLQEAVVVQFGSEEHAIFLSTLPIEFNDSVRLVRREGGADAEGSVVAVQYDEGQKAVAVRFTNGPCQWVAQR